jgi:hypothetical protein
MDIEPVLHATPPDLPPETLAKLALMRANITFDLTAMERVTTGACCAISTDQFATALGGDLRVLMAVASGHQRGARQDGRGLIARCRA